MTYFGPQELTHRILTDDCFKNKQIKQQNHSCHALSMDQIASRESQVTEQSTELSPTSRTRGIMARKATPRLLSPQAFTIHMGQ